MLAHYPAEVKRQDPLPAGSEIVSMFVGGSSPNERTNDREVTPCVTDPVHTVVRQFSFRPYA